MQSQVASRPHVVVLNGVGSVGKSSTARALQQIARKPFLHVSLDAFLEMLPKEMLGHPEGIVFEPLEEDGHPAIALRIGPVVERLLLGMRHAIAAMAAQGNHLIVDDVLLAPGQEQLYRDLLAACDLRLVGLFAPLDVLEARERQRGDRHIGLARWQFGRVHLGRTYDLEIDTTRTTPAASAERIRDTFGL